VDREAAQSHACTSPAAVGCGEPLYCSNTKLHTCHITPWANSFVYASKLSVRDTGALQTGAVTAAVSLPLQGPAMAAVVAAESSAPLRLVAVVAWACLALVPMAQLATATLHLARAALAAALGPQTVLVAALVEVQVAGLPPLQLQWWAGMAHAALCGQATHAASPAVMCQAHLGSARQHLRHPLWLWPPAHRHLRPLQPAHHPRLWLPLALHLQW
jgi:hypothetical protein